MHSQAFAGMLAAGVLSYLVIFAYSVSAEARGARDPENRVFGLLAFSLAVFSAGSALHYLGDPEAAARGILVATIGRVGAAAFLLHLVWLATLSTKAARTPAAANLRILYGLAIALAILTAARARVPLHGEVHEIVLLGVIRLREVSLPASPIDAGVVGFTTAAIALSFLAAVRALPAQRGKRENVSRTVGTALLLFATLHDDARDFGWIEGPRISVYGYWLLVLSVVFTRLAGFSLLRGELETRTRDLRRQSRELSRAYAELRAAQDELVRKEQLAAVGELSAVVAHEVRNPLAIISNAVATLRRSGIGDADRATLLTILDEESSRLNHLVGDLLRYARPVNLERQLIGLRELVERGMGLADGKLGLDAELCEPEPTEKIWGDPNLLRQVIDNLIANAIQAMSGGGVLTVTLVNLELEGARGVDLRDRGHRRGHGHPGARPRPRIPSSRPAPAAPASAWPSWPASSTPTAASLRIESKAGAGTVMSVFLPRTGERSLRPQAGDPGRSSSEPPLPPELRESLRRGSRALTRRRGYNPAP